MILILLPRFWIFTFWHMAYLLYHSLPLSLYEGGLCVFFSELFDSTLETLHPITLKYLSVYFLRLSPFSS